MHLSRTTAALVTAGLASAAPHEKRTEVTDPDILNYALTLEHLEDNFYREGLDKYSEDDFSQAGCDTTFYENLKKVSQDESDHVAFLTEALSAAGATPVEKCEYDFGYTDVDSFLATASILEGVGVSAYLGAAADIMNKTYLTAAGSVLTVEARHSSYLSAKLDQSPYPQAFDAPLTLNEVYSLASAFIVSCPESNPLLPVKAFPTLMMESSGEEMEMVHTGDTVTLTTEEDIEGSEGEIYAAFIAVTGPTFVEAAPVDSGFSVTLPEGFAGQTYVVLTKGNESVTDDTVVAGPAIVEIAS